MTPIEDLVEKATEAAQPLGPTSLPARLVRLEEKLPQLLQISASEAIFDVLRDRGTPAEHQMRNAHRSLFDIVAEDVPRDEEQVCMYMRPVQVWLLRGALDLLLEKNNKRLIELFETLPRAMQEQAIGIIEQFAVKASQDAVAQAKAGDFGPYTAPPLPPVDGQYKRLPERQRMSPEEVIAFTKEVWGPWLKACHPSLPADAMSRQDLLQRDARLYYRLQVMRELGGLGAVFQTKSQRLDGQAALALKAGGDGDPKELRAVAARIAMRGYRALRQAQPSAEGSTQDAAAAKPEP